MAEAVDTDMCSKTAQSQGESSIPLQEQQQQYEVSQHSDGLHKLQLSDIDIPMRDDVSFI